jgi:hypothetical protein
MCRTLFGRAAAARPAGVVARVQRWVSGRLSGRGRTAPPSDRKLLLLLAGCGRHLWPALRPDGDWNREWVERVERVADGSATADDLRAVLGPGLAVAASVTNFPYGLAAMNPAGLWDKIDRLTRAGLLDPRAVDGYFGWESAAGCGVVREVIGDPFRPVAFDPTWGTSTARVLARQMYDSREFSAMPILADALQDAGCENEDILTHCRGPGPHVRGCWVVDLLLGKE